MLDHLAPFELLLDSGPEGWTRSRMTGEDSVVRNVESFWAHRNGLKLAIHSHSLSSWKLGFRTGTDTLVVVLPRSRASSLARRLAPVWQDLQPWLLAIDLEPRTRIARQISGWLVGHRQQGPITVTVMGPEHPSMMVAPTGRYPEQSIPVPQDLVAMLQDDLRDFWNRPGTPSHTVRTVNWTPDLPIQKGFRSFRLDLPTTQHARMELMHGISDSLRSIPWPDPVLR